MDDQALNSARVPAASWMPQGNWCDVFPKGRILESFVVSCRSYDNPSIARAWSVFAGSKTKGVKGEFFFWGKGMPFDYSKEIYVGKSPASDYKDPKYYAHLRHYFISGRNVYPK